MTNARQTAQDIVALINTSPRSPRQDEIAAIIEKHQLFGGLLRQQLPMQPHAPIPAPQASNRIGRGRGNPELYDGEVSEWDPIPLTFDPEEFAAQTPWLRMAFELLNRDHVGAREVVRSLLEGDDGELFIAMLKSWETIAQKMSALPEILQAAHCRAVLSFCVVAPDHPADVRLMDIGNAPGVAVEPNR